MKKVILVEDNKIERENIIFALSQIGSVTLLECFHNGAEALEYLKNNDIDIVITDIQMPEMDGIELIKNIRELAINAEVIIISGHNDFDNAKSAVGLDVVEYLMKPIIDDELNDAMALAIERCNKKQSKKTDYERLKTQVAASKNLLCEQFIRNLIVNSDTSAEYIKENQELLSINLTDGYKITLIIRIKGCRNASALIVTYALVDYILRRKSENISFFPFVLNEDEVGTVVVSSDYDSIVSEVIKLKNDIIHDYDITIVVAASSVSEKINNVNRQYLECKSILDGISQTNNTVIIYDDICEVAERENVLIKIQSEVRKYILEGNMNGIKETLKAALDLAEDNIIGKRNFAYGYVNILEIILSEFGYTFDDSIGEKEIWKKLADLDSILNLSNYLKNLTMSVIELINSETDEKVMAVKRIKDIIKQKYSERITVASIASEINFSSKQTHRIFTQSTGQSIFEYLTDYRIEMAKKYLIENKSIDDVIYLVGYRDRTYFSEIFKEKTGMTPAEYKKKNNR